jgi:hypothetical protein
MSETPDHETPEGRLLAFAEGMMENDETLFPLLYMAAADAAPLLADMRNVLGRLKAAESSIRGV